MQCTSSIVRLALLGALLVAAVVGTPAEDTHDAIKVLTMIGLETADLIKAGDCPAAAQDVIVLNRLWRHKYVEGLHTAVGGPLSVKLGQIQGDLTRDLRARPIKPCGVQLLAMASFISGLLTTPN